MATTYFGRYFSDLMDEFEEYDHKELGAKLNVDPSVISSWMNGSALPDYNQIKAISDFFKVSADAICDTEYVD